MRTTHTLTTRQRSAVLAALALYTAHREDGAHTTGPNGAIREIAEGGALDAMHTQLSMSELHDLYQRLQTP